jgi:hypothetical protein
MLIRIAPDMFLDKRFECNTIREVWIELFQTSKFKTKYPWRKDYKKKIKALGETQVKKGEFVVYLKTIKNLIETGTINNKTGKYFNFSKVDQIISSCVLAHQYEISTVDKDLINFLEQEFSKRNVSPLHLVNKWLEKGLIEGDDKLQSILEDWAKCGEAAQPRSEKSAYKQLTGRKYLGS